MGLTPPSRLRCSVSQRKRRTTCTNGCLGGGATLYNPLTVYGAGKTAKDVGIVGIGGLGHFGLLFAKALGANVTAISHSESKKADAEKMGATRFIATHGGGEDNFKPYARSLDLIICTSSKFADGCKDGADTA